MGRGRIRIVIMLLSLGLLQSCSTGYAPVTERSMGARDSGVSVVQTQSRPAPLPNPGSYTVKRGDTLYSISWRYGLDYREVARWNNVNERFQIYPGQVLNLLSATGTAAVAQVPVTPPARPQTPPQVNNQTPPQLASQSTTPASAQLPTANASTARPATTPATTPAASPATTPATTPATQVSSVVGQISWRWPANGQIIRRFSAVEGGSKGIDIAGKMGDAVVAAADGRVVYAGSGLLGYGNLVIINHNREFLSAYAHNSRILVSENDMVKSGVKIAEMGQTGTDRVQLHFEIRRDGKPVDPLVYLPKR